MHQQRTGLRAVAFVRGPLSVEVDGRVHALGGELADKMRVEVRGVGT